MKRNSFLILLLLTVLAVLPVNAQRKMDVLSRGLVAVKTDNGVFLSWRRLGEEYYDVTYNIYRNGTKLNSTPLKVTNYTDTGGSSLSKYTVSAVVRGIEQTQCKETKAWTGQVYEASSCWSGFMEISLAKVYDNTGADITETYVPNDAEIADLDGDGEMEIIIKRISTKDANDLFVSRTDGAYDRIDAYKLDGTLLWWIDVGPNMVSGGSHEINVIAYDWDGDGKAEVLLRGADDMIVHGQRGQQRQEYPQRIGTKGVDTRNTVSHTANMTYTNTGGEYLVYMDGDHGIIYDAVRYMEYPLTRGKASDWGDNYGHRSSKYFFGAPFLDGRNPSIFLARGIYTRHKMVAYDVEPSDHSLTQRWYWECLDSNSPWYGNGNHNYCIADVDMDGRDEIVYGSMVIDDNGKGLSTTGLGHGDALHCSDFDPFRHGLEIFACNEDNPSMNYRDATTSHIYYRIVGTDDDGRAICANVSNNYPGAMGRSANTGIMSCVKDAPIEGLENYVTDLNFRIYWDGDLLSEMFSSPGTEREAKVEKPGFGRLFTSSGCKMNNWTKNTPCFLGDIIGDWREEFVSRLVETNTKIRIYTTAVPTDYSIYTLWHDHQYRQAMVWQMHAYNQPPHLSYFLGEMEGYTVAPPPLTTNGRTELANGATINTSYNDKHLLHNQYMNTSLNVEEGAAPYILTINVPTLVQGTNSNSTTNPKINRTTYTCNLTGGALTGDMRLVKQGDGILNMSSATHTYTGETNIWGGTVNFNGTLSASPVALKRATTLNTSGGVFSNSITMEYGATINVGGATDGNISTVTVGELNMGYGARVKLDVNGLGPDEHDWLNVTTLNIDDSKVGVDAWKNFGPKYITPVIEIHAGSALAKGFYPIGNVDVVNGDVSRVAVECNFAGNYTLEIVDGQLGVNVGGIALAEKPGFALIGMNNFDLSAMYPNMPESSDCYLPVVSVIPTNTDGIEPVLSATFTDLDGNTTELGSNEVKTVLSENYESAKNADDWESSCSKNLNSTDGYGRYINIASENSGGTRRAYKTFYANGSDFYGRTGSYTVEFDALFHRTNADGNINELVLFGEGAPMPPVDGYFANKTSNYLFRLTGGNNNTTYGVEGSSATANIGDKWCHYTITVDKELRKVTYTVKNGSATVLSGSYTANTDANMNVQGIGIGLGRAWSYAYIDNIVIDIATDISTYAFTKPGTLSVTASVTGYADATASYTVEKPYAKIYESPDYNTVAAANAPAVLGEEYWRFNEANSHVDCRDWTRFAFWANITYTFAINKVNSGSETMFVDKDKRIWVDYTGSQTALHLVEGFGLAQSGGSTFHASNLGDEKTIIYHRYDRSLGNAANIFEEYFNGNADGTYKYGKANDALQKFIAWKPISWLWGDLNHDGDVSLVDVMLLVDCILNEDFTTVVFDEADLNNDDNVSLVDIMELVGYILER